MVNDCLLDNGINAISNKKNISSTFAVIRKFGGKVFTFNSKKALYEGMKGFVDHLVIYKGNVYFIEVKIGKDKLSFEQEELKKDMEIVGLKNKNTYYKNIVSLYDARKLLDEILSK